MRLLIPVVMVGVCLVVISYLLDRQADLSTNTFRILLVSWTLLLGGFGIVIPFGTRLERLPRRRIRRGR